MESPISNCAACRSIACDLQVQAVEVHAVHRRVQQIEHDLGQRRTAGVPGADQFLDQFFVGRILVRVGIESYRRERAEAVPGSWGAARSLRITRVLTKVPTSVLRSRLSAVGDWHRDGQIRSGRSGGAISVA